MEASAVLGALNHLLETHTEREQGYLSRLADLDSYVEHLQNELDNAHEHIRKLQQQQDTALQCNPAAPRAIQNGAVPHQPGISGTAPATNTELRALEQHYQYLLDIQDQKLKMYYTKYKRYKLNFQELLRSKVCELCNAELVRNTALPNGMDNTGIAPLPTKQVYTATAATMPPYSHHINGHVVRATNVQRTDQLVDSVQHMHQPATDRSACPQGGSVHGSLPGQTVDVNKHHPKQPITTQHDAVVRSLAHTVQPSVYTGLHTTTAQPVVKQPSCRVLAHGTPVRQAMTSTSNIPVSSAPGVVQNLQHNGTLQHVQEDCNGNLDEWMHHHTTRHGEGPACTTQTHLQPLQTHQQVDDSNAMSGQRDVSSKQKGMTKTNDQLCKQGSHGGQQAIVPITCSTSFDTGIDRHVVRIPETQWPAVPGKFVTTAEGIKPTPEAQRGTNSIQNGPSPGPSRHDWKTDAAPAMLPDMSADVVAKHPPKQPSASIPAQQETPCSTTMHGFNHEQMLSEQTRLATISDPATSKDHAGNNLVRPAAASNGNGNVKQRTGLIDMLMGESISQEGSDAQGKAYQPPPVNANVTNAQSQHTTSKTTQDGNGQVASLADGFAFPFPQPIQNQQQAVQVAEQQGAGLITIMPALSNGCTPTKHDVEPQTKSNIGDTTRVDRLEATANNKLSNKGYANGITMNMAGPGFFILPGTEFPESPQVAGGKTSAACSNHEDGKHGDHCVDEAWARHHSNGINNANQAAGLLVPAGVMKEESNHVMKPTMTSSDKLHSRCQNSASISDQNKTATTGAGGQGGNVSMLGNEGAVCDVDDLPLRQKDRCAAVDTNSRGIIPTDAQADTDERCTKLHASTPTKHAAHQIEVIEIYSPEACPKQPPTALLAAESSFPAAEKLPQPPCPSKHPQLLDSPFKHQSNVNLPTRPDLEHLYKLQAEHANSEPRPWPTEPLDSAATVKDAGSKLPAVQNLIAQMDLCGSLSDDLNSANGKKDQVDEGDGHLLHRKEALAMPQQSCELHVALRHDDIGAWNTKADRAQRSQSFDAIPAPANKGSKAVQSFSQSNKKQSKILTCKGYVRKSTPVIKCNGHSADQIDMDPLDRVPPVVVKGSHVATNTVASNHDHSNISHNDVGTAGPEFTTKQPKQHASLVDSQQQIKPALSQPSGMPTKHDSSRRQRRAKPNKAAKRQLPDALSPTALGSPLAISPHIKVKRSCQMFDELDASIEREALDRQAILRPEKPLTAEEKQQLGSITMVLFQQAGLDSQANDYETADEAAPSHSTFGMNAGHKQSVKCSKDIDTKRSSEAAQKELDIPRKQHKSAHSREHSMDDVDISQERAAQHSKQQPSKLDRHLREAVNGDAGYKYAEVVRGAARADLNGYACDTCRAFYEACVSWDVELHEPMCGHARPAAASAGGDGNTSAAAAAKDALIQGLSKHRARYVPPPSTPDGFWALTFPDESKESPSDPLDA